MDIKTQIKQIEIQLVITSHAFMLDHCITALYTVILIVETYVCYDLGPQKFLFRQFKPQCLAEAEREVPPRSGLGGKREMLSSKAMQRQQFQWSKVSDYGPQRSIVASLKNYTQPFLVFFFNSVLSPLLGDDLFYSPEMHFSF